MKQVEIPYSDEQIETAHEYVISKMSLLTPVENDITPVEKHFGVQGLKRLLRGSN